MVCTYVCVYVRMYVVYDSGCCGGSSLVKYNDVDESGCNYEYVVAQAAAGTVVYCNGNVCMMNDRALVLWLGGLSVYCEGSRTLKKR